MTDKPKGASDFVTEAYNAGEGESLKQFYAKWAEDYDAQMLGNLNYTSPATVALAMQEHLTNRKARILDVGCGTGLTGDQLHQAGYTNLHGLDLSADMIEMSRQRGIYRSLLAADVNLPLEFESGWFEGIISSGTFTHGHVGSEPLTELFRIMKRGGILACTIHEDLWAARDFDKAFLAMERQGTAVCLSRTYGSYFKGEEPVGFFCVYRKVTD